MTVRGSQDQLSGLGLSDLERVAAFLRGVSEVCLREVLTCTPQSREFAAGRAAALAELVDAVESIIESRRKVYEV